MQRHAGMNLESYHDARRFEEIARLHANAFEWKPQGRIPLGIHVNDPAHMEGVSYSEWLNPEPFFEVPLKSLRDTLEVGSDLLPHVAINHLGDVIVPSMFGTELFIPEKASATLQDVGPTPLAAFSSIDETVGLEAPPLDAGIVPDVERMMRFYRERLPDWVHLVTPMCVGAFSTALELCGSPLMLEMIDRPAPPLRPGSATGRTGRSGTTGSCAWSSRWRPSGADTAGSRRRAS